ncbi:hypothetical protein OVA26_11770 [Microbacterium sp. SL62]|jgi:hypothetical protein|uniref:hypothetical protein n=1 Tax=Microbacterium sp. SL62 TaxID=2995139 RepID=UPI0022751FF4|nr:hypothetical protein [Microbacterium sp. SL62]MCY1717620.1 hypothetical protein [Microbacterium sp. SL62]
MIDPRRATWFTAAAIVVIAGAAVPLAGVSIAALIFFILLCTRRPQLALSIWMIAISFLPIWVATSGFATVPISTFVALACVAVVGLGGAKFSPVDGIVGALVLIAGLATYFAGSPPGELVNIVSLWVVSYLAGRILCAQIGVQRAGSIFAVVMSAVAVLAVVEFLFGWHPFSEIFMPNLLYEIWSPIQERGGVARSEWAFGHSIALGGSLALALPFAITMPAPLLVRVACVSALFAGVAVTFSRSALISMVLATALVILFSRSASAGTRTGVAALTGVAAIVIVPSVLAVFTTAGDEVTNSGAYRGDLLSTIPYMNWLGQSAVVQISPTGFRTYGRFVSIDSALISVGLDFGLLLAISLGALYLVPIVRTLTRRANVAEIALAGQLPLILTVAFITQWQALLWVVAGFAVSGAIKSSRIVTNGFLHEPSSRGNREFARSIPT